MRKLLALWIAVWMCGTPLHAQTPLPAHVKNALAYMAREHDRFHAPGFLLFDDHASGGCNLFPSAWMGDLVPGTPEPAWVKDVLNELWSENAAEGNHCLRIEYPHLLARNGTEGWVAVGSKTEKDALGRQIGFDLRRFVAPGEAVHLSFKVRGQRGNEQIEFKAFSSDPAPAPTKLSKQWSEVRLPIAAAKLNEPIRECFVWATNRQQNSVGAVFFVDRIRIEFGPKGTKARLSDPRFIRSFVPRPALEPDKYFRNASTIYDQALAISVLAATGELERARLIADALVYASENDRRFKDGRLRNAYLCGDLAQLGRDGPEGATRLPGWWDFKERKWFEDAYYDSSDCGNAAWAMLGLLNYWQAAGKAKDSPHLRTAARLGEWVDRNAFAPEGGFYGGLEGFDDKQTRSPWKSTEHSIDLYAAYKRLADATGNARFAKLAEHARAFVDSMWNETDGHFFTGTTDDGKTINRKPVPLDVQAWSALVFPEDPRCRRAVAWADKNCRVPVGAGMFAYDFDTDKDAVWWEGTAQMATAFRLLKQPDAMNQTLAALRAHALVQEGAGQGAVYAASKDGLTTGFQKVFAENADPAPWVYYRRPHLGAACWFIASEIGLNVYWGDFIR